MPSYRITTLLLISTAIALWLSTFTPYTSADDIRRFIILAITAMSLTAAACTTGPKRAYWCGFAGTLLAFVSRSLTYNIVPQFNWLNIAASNLAGFFGDGGNPAQTNIQVTLAVISWLLTAMAIGWLCAYVYRAIQRQK